MHPKKPMRLSPGRMIFLSIFITIIIGTCLLALPWAHIGSISFIDLFFTATSATCVTGLFTIPLDQFTPFGHTILLILIQIGGLGLITMTLFLMSLFIELGLATQLMAGQVFEIDTWKNIRKILLFIITLTITSELLGAVILFTRLPTHVPWGTASFNALFHAISSFCNAGIIINHALIDPLLQTNSGMLITGILILIGGLGFLAWAEIFRAIKAWLHHKRVHLSLYTKIILWGTAALITTTTILFWILEHENLLAQTGTLQSLALSLFYAISMRSAGFLPFGLVSMHIASLFLIMIISFIGSSPGSTGSGIKITTFALFIATIKAAITGRTSVEIKERRIPADLVYKATAIISLSAGWIACITFCLLITEPTWSLGHLLFETMSAFNTVGIEIGVTHSLSSIGKIFIIASMIVGRIGSFTLLIALKIKRKSEVAEFSYPEERVMLG
jgi:trk system potassium uptake protein TrkH